MSMCLASGEFASNSKENLSVFGLHFTNVLNNHGYCGDISVDRPSQCGRGSGHHCILLPSSSWSVLGACWGTEELGWNERSRKKITRREITIKWGFDNYEL